MMTEKKRNWWILVLGCGVLILTLCLLYGWNKESMPHSNLSLPPKTRVVIHFSTSTTPDSYLHSKPQSQIFDYDNQGNILKNSIIDEEVVGPFIAKRNDSLAFLFKDHTVLATTSQSKRLESDSSIDFEAINFGSSQSGYIDDLPLTYSLLNVGMLPNKPYTNVIRFISDTESYDVEVPYYLEDIVYDQEQKRMFCIIHNSELDSNANIELAYVIANYDQDVGRFVLENEQYVVVTSTPINIHYRKSMIHENKLYSIAYRDTLEYMSDPNPSKIRTCCDLVLCTYDLTTNKKLPEKILIDDFDLNQTGGDLLLSGSNQLPMCVVNNNLYAFLKTNEVWIVDKHGEIIKKDLPYIFQDTLNLKKPSDTASSVDFFSSEIKVNKDGDIYILNLYSDKIFRIHRLCDEGTYELVWEGSFPENVPKNMSVNDFELIE